MHAQAQSHMNSDTNNSLHGFRVSCDLDETSDPGCSSCPFCELLDGCTALVELGPQTRVTDTCIHAEAHFKMNRAKWSHRCLGFLAITTKQLTLDVDIVPSVSWLVYVFTHIE